MHWTTFTLPPLLTLLTFTQCTTALKFQEKTRIRATFTPNCPSSSTPPSALDEKFTVALNIRSDICQGVPVPMPLGYFDEVDHVSVALEVLEDHKMVVSEGADKVEVEEEKPTPPSISWSISTSHPSASSSSSSTTPHHTSTTSITSTHSTGIEAITWKRAPNLEVCRVQLYERPGCYGTPLIQREFGTGAGIGGETKCVTRSPAYMGLGEVFVKVSCVDGSLPHPVPKGKSHASANGTVSAGGVHHGGVHGGALNATAMDAAHGNGTMSARGSMADKWQRRRMALLGR
ncbi:uncharacterized protein BDV14DRAFT_195297 [Aspergillus stella-maris]|uniref:uncharacterized protein n=1 Tax=Aspergillus stella-maris TaxID=1810926 RepID=UPI003CCD507C